MKLVDSIRRRCGYQFPPLGGLAFRTAFQLLPKRANVELVPGIRADLDFRDDTMRATYWQGGRFERPTGQVLHDWVAAGATHFFDIGSNYGFFSYWLLSRSPQLEVHAFEPHPKTFAVIESIKGANSLGRLHPCNIGLGDQRSRLALHPGISDSGHSTFGAHPDLGGHSLGEIEVLPFDEWRREAGLTLPEQPQWIAKIDVEGFEMRVLRGMAETLQAKSFAGLVIEVNEYTLAFCGSSPTEVRQIMADSGYRALFIGAGSGNEFFVPETSLRRG